MTRRSIHVAILNEGTDVWRSVEAEELREGVFRIPTENSPPDHEHWEFLPGSVVRCDQRQLSIGLSLVAVLQVND